MNRQNFLTVLNPAKRVEKTSGTLCRQWHSVWTESTSGVYKRCKQTESNNNNTFVERHSAIASEALAEQVS